jgi:23S rRNA (uracil1939-C5)-methyltransferase
VNKPQKGDQFELHIDRLSYDGGRGVGRHEGFVYFVPDTAPEELAIVEVVDVKKNYGVAKVKEILKPSPHRRLPPCPVAHECGGCVWQHIQYAEQIHQKELLLQHQLRGLLSAECKTPTVIASPNEFRYRHRIQIQVDTASIADEQNRRDTGSRSTQTAQFGFFKSGSNDLVATKDCLISDERLFDGLSSSLDFQKAICHAKEREPLKKFTKVELALDNHGQRHVRPLASIESEFTQANFELNKSLQSHVVQLASDFFAKISTAFERTAPVKLGEQSHSQIESMNTIYDLYCGSGNFSFALLDVIRPLRLVGVELSASAIQRAKTQFETSTAREKISNAEFIVSDVGAYLKKLKQLADQTVVLVDPPRAGLDQKTVQELQRLKPRLMIYVSCALPSLSRDIRNLTGYKITNAVGFDMFPQTEYLETVVTLERTV